MKIRDKKRWFLLICCFIGFLLPLSLLAEGGNYDVSYFWATRLQTAKAYLRKVRRVLGPKAAEQIQVVRSETDHYGVIYDRDGSYQTALQLAQHHAQLLHQAGVVNQSGLSVACPIRDQGYAPIKQLSDTPSKSLQQDIAVDSRLEAEIDQYVKRLRQRGMLSRTDQTSFVVYDISESKKVVSINEDRPIMAASLIKNFVMLAYFHEVKHKRVQHTNQNRYHLRQMIQRSSNSSTNHLIKLLGGPRKVNQILSQNYPYFEQTRIVEYIPAGGRTYRNTTSAHDLNRFYNQLWLGNLPYSSKMEYYLGLPNGDRIHDNTSIPDDVRVYNKTGTVYGMVGDSGILVIKDAKGERKAYAFIGMIEDRTKTDRRNRSQPFASWVKRRSDVLRHVSEVSYKYIYGGVSDGALSYR